MQKSYADFGIILTSTRTDPNGNAYTTCPQCKNTRRKNKNSKCLSVNTYKEVWNCHHCGWSGTLKGSGKQWKADSGWNLPEWSLPALPVDKKPVPESIYQWFEKRGIEREYVDKHKILYRSTWVPQLECYAPVIWFPYYRDSHLINIKYRHLDKHFKLHTGAERILYGLDDIKGHDTVVIVEGEIDKMTMDMASYPNCVSVPNGAPPINAKDTSGLFTFLDDARLEKVKHFIIAVDNDEPGIKLKDELIHRLGKHRCSVVTWPADCKDANDTLVKKGLAVLVEAIYAARMLPVEGSIEVHQVMPDVMTLYREEMTPGVSTGWEGVDELYRVRQGLWTLITGIPGHGKSEWLDALLINLSHEHGWSHAIFSPENQPVKQHVSKLIEKRIGKPFNKKHMLAMNEDEVLQGGNWLNNHFTFIAAPDNSFTLDFILETAERLVLRKGIKGLVIDPWNEIEHQKQGQQSETDYISSTITRLRRFAQRHNIHIWLVAHPTKMQRVIKKMENPRTGKQKEYSIYPVPTPYDVSGSAHFRNKADNAITVYRWQHPDFIGEPVEIHVQKIRFKPDGRIGKVLMHYDINTGCYRDAPPSLEDLG
jgi:twinkle protein